MISNYNLIIWLAIIAAVHIILTWGISISRGRRARSEKTQKLTTSNEGSPPVSILIPAWNERGTLTACIHSLKMLNYPCWEAVIIAGGEDGTYEEALRVSEGDSRFHILTRGPEPKNVALLHGIEVAQYDMFVLLDADSIVTPGWLEALISTLSHDTSASIGHRLPKKDSWISQIEQMEDIQTFDIQGINPFYGDCSMAIRRETFSRIGGLPSGAYSREDWELEERIRKTGGKIGFARDAILYTDRPSTLKEYYQYKTRIHRARIDGILEERSNWIQHPAWILGKVYYFVLGIFLSLLLIIYLVLYFIHPSIRHELFYAILLVFIWLSGRRAGLSLGVYAYTGDLKWLLKIPGYIFLFFINCFTALVVLLAGRRQEAIYQGPRASAMPGN